MSGYDRGAAVELIMSWIDRWGWQALAHGPIPPADTEALEAARREAERVAAESGRRDELTRLRRTIAEWALEQYRRHGLGAVYFGETLEDPATRREAIDVLIDAATAALLGDLLPDETAAALAARLDVHLGGPLYARPADEPGPGANAPKDAP